jgi:large subunit ribosomal protein L25
MKETLLIEAKPREARGSNAAGRLRRSGRLPAVVYGKGCEAMPLELMAHDFERVLQHHRGEHLIVDLVVAGETKKALLQDVQRNPLNGRPVHVDFHVISMTEKLRVKVPLELVGTPVGVAQQGGVLDHLLREIEIECLPSDIPEQISVDVSALEIGKHLTAKDIQLDPARYVMLTAPDIAIAAVFLPKVEEEAPAVTEEAAAAEPEVLTEKKAEERAESEAASEEKEPQEEKEKEKGGKEKAERAR